MKVYLAAAWSRRLEILEVAHKLENVGVEITSNWLTEEAGMNTGAREKFLRDRAYIDLADVDRADILVRFTDPEYLETDVYEAYTTLLRNPVPRKLLSAARMVEMGYALAKGKTVIVIGGKQNVFDRVASVVHLDTVDDLVRYLSQED